MYLRTANNDLIPYVISIGPDGNPLNQPSFTPSVLSAGVDRSASILAGGASQVLAAANLNRKSLVGQNISTDNLWISENGNAASVGTAGSYKIASGQSFSIQTNRSISIIGPTTGQAFTATEI